MALHGEIKVNGKIIGEWIAQRKEKAIGTVNTYICSLSEVVDGVARAHHFEIEHTYSDGASVLASKLLAQRPADWPVGDPNEERPPEEDR